MKIEGKNLVSKAQEALQSCLGGVPFLKFIESKVEHNTLGGRVDLSMSVALPDGERQLLVVEVKNNGQPRYAREAVNQLFRFLQVFPDAYGVFIAPYITPQAAEILDDEDIGYVDLSGNCRICFKNIYIVKDGQTNKYAKRRDLRSLYSPKAERVLRVLLTNPMRKWKLKDLSKEAQVSLGQTSNVKKLLIDREWIDVAPGGIWLSNPWELLKEWSGAYKFDRNRFLKFYSFDSIAEIEAELADFCVKNKLSYALTGFSGVARLAPSVRYQRVWAYIDPADEELMTETSFKSVANGENISIMVPYDKGVFYGAGEIDGVNVASPVQVYLDVLNLRGRGEEAAKAILEGILRPQW